MHHEMPRVIRRAGPFGCALTVDVEEWYHTCLVPEYVRPEARPELTHELDRVIPEMLETFAAAGRTATFFVLGEVAERLPRRVREIAAAGHEVGSHGYLHLRATERSLDELAYDLRRSREVLEDVVGEPVRGFRAPEWSLRCLSSARLPLVAEAGFLYDSSLAPCAFTGRLGNPRFISYLQWGSPEWGGPPERELLELPPLTFGGPLRLPAGSWTGRLVHPARLVRAARAHQEAGGLPVAVVHPWEITGRPTPGRLTGVARFIHETGRDGFDLRFRELLRALPWTSVRESGALTPEAERPAALAHGFSAALPVG
jgi:peptidoglycan/xylan/chitin deacetylase (PgdA/CDA1 family)